MTVLVTGGAGYIGSHMTWTLLDRGEDVVVADDLSTGTRALIAPDATFLHGNVGDATFLRTLFEKFEIDAVIHFAGSIIVPESVAKPLDYYRNNTIATHTLIKACVQAGVKNFIFSSTATIYGEVSGQVPIAESTLLAPINPYGRSKLGSEWMLADAASAHDFRYVALRYFNVAGADPKGRTGQSTPRATHLIKRACQVALGRFPCLEIFGTDFDTPDGTGIRDYIHVDDLVGVHALVLDYLRAGGSSTILNCGYGHSHSVRQVIAAVERAASCQLPVREAGRRPGDPTYLVADSSKLRSTVMWKPAWDDLGAIVRSAFEWERRLV